MTWGARATLASLCLLTRTPGSNCLFPLQEPSREVSRPCGIHPGSSGLSFITFLGLISGEPGLLASVLLLRLHFLSWE